MKNDRQELEFIRQSVPQLQDYLLSNELYWPLGGNLPRLTPGSLELALLRLESYAPAEVGQLRGQVDAVRLKWRTAWEKKVARELANRLRLWSQFLSDYLRAPDLSPEYYQTEVRNRVILQLLLPGQSDFAEKDALAELDHALKARLVVGPFIWDEIFLSAFPKTEFWFLYGTI